MKYTSSICSTCRYMNDCVLTTNKNTISSCSEYVHIFDDEREAIIFKDEVAPKIKTIIRRQRPVMVSF